MPLVATLEQIFGLRGHRAIVTGASSGLGVEFAETLAMAGADVALVARRADRLEEVAGRLGEYAVRSAVVPGDLAAHDTIPEIFSRCEEALGPIDILVNNAGLHDPQRAEKVARERWSRLLDVNLSAVFFLCQEFARRRFQHGGPGRIVNLGSIFGATASPTPGFASYAAAKGALTMLTRQLAIEWGKRGITVNTLAPGYFPTDLTAKDFERPEIRERAEMFVPLGRLGKPGELRAALLFLVSPASGYVTGSTVFVDGGYTAW
jgi:NAD(P)-dependent dehydrogenase (short-subunit alcohol dehydrogenase family)